MRKARAPECCCSEQGTGVRYALLDRVKRTETKVKLLILFHFMRLRENVFSFFKTGVCKSSHSLYEKCLKLIPLCLNVVYGKYS